MASLLESFYLCSAADDNDGADESISTDDDYHLKQKQQRELESRQLRSLRKLKLLSEKAKQDVSLTGREISTEREITQIDNDALSDPIDMPSKASSGSKKGTCESNESSTGNDVQDPIEISLDDHVASAHVVVDEHTAEVNNEDCDVSLQGENGPFKAADEKANVAIEDDVAIAKADSQVVEEVAVQVDVDGSAEAAQPDESSMKEHNEVVKGGDESSEVTLLASGSGGVAPSSTCDDASATTGGGGRGGVAGGILRNSDKSAIDPSQSIECDYDVNPTKLFLLLQEKRWAEAAKHCDTHQVDAATWISRKEEDGRLRWRLLPLHAAIIFKAPADVIEGLLRSYPRGAAEKDDPGMLPIHLAVRNGSPVAVVQLLLAAYPDGINAKDGKGRVPLVLAEASKSPDHDAVVEALQRCLANHGVASTEEDTKASSDADTTSARSEKYECDYNVSPTILYVLIQEKRWSDAAKRCEAHQVDAATWISRKGKDGRLVWRLLPLHAAVIFEAPAEVIEGLLRSYPSGATKKEDQGMLPIHLAARNGSPAAVVQLLLDAYPDSINVKDGKGRVPLVLAEASKSPNRDAIIEAVKGSLAYNAAAGVEV